MSTQTRSPARPWPQSHEAWLFSSSAPPAFGGRRDREQAAEHGALEQALEDRAQQRLVEWADIDQQHEDGEPRERERELLPGVERLPPEDDPWRPVRSGPVIVPRGPHRTG